MKIRTDQMFASNGEDAVLDDSALLAWRAKARAELERLPPHSAGHAELAARYDLSTREVEDRARSAWSAGGQQPGVNDTPVNDSAAVISVPPPRAARRLAVDILLAEPEALGDDVLESCLYILREQLSEG
jgi:hypothetical protein